MCNENSIRNYLIAGYSAILSAIGFIVTAAVLNNSFFGAPGAPFLMLSAAGFTGLASLFFSFAKGKMEEYIKCMGYNDSCSASYNNFFKAINALIVVLGIQTTACLAAAGIAWIPWFGAVPMYAIIGTLIIQFAVGISLIIFAIELINCLKKRKTSKYPAHR